MLEKKKTGYRKYITKHYKAIVSVHLEELKKPINVSGLHKHRYVPIITQALSRHQR